MKPELLAPAGSPASLKAAIEAGANSVYMGAIWNARMRARNFSKSELARAINYCHKNNVLAYITLNTLIFEKEMPAVADYIRFVYEHGADALIVQDFGVAKMAREIAPNLPLHASTQLSVHNSKTARLLKKLGFSRLILARELSLEQIKRIHEEGGAEVEIFCHGALCYSYSGKCFFSLSQTGRSANRGTCAQICRFPWKLYCNGKYIKTGYFTSTKDLNTLSHIPEISKARINCIKIEGRLKDAAYVKSVVSAYRRAIDTGICPDCSQLSYREYTEGYLFNSAKKEKITNPMTPSFSGMFIGKVVKAGRNGAQIQLTSPLKIGDSVRTNSNGKIIEIFRIYRNGKEVVFAQDECTLRIKTIHTGDKLYKVTRAQIENDILNEYSPQKTKSARKFIFESRKLSFPSISLTYFSNKKLLQNNSRNAVVIPFEHFTDTTHSSDILSYASKIVVDTPRIAFDNDLPVLEQKMREISERKPFAFMVSEPSLVSEYATIVSPYANVTNTWAVSAWEEFGNIAGVVPSLEIAHTEIINKFHGFSNYTGYRSELMISENDLFFELGFEGKCELEDPRGNRFEIIKSGGKTIILKRAPI